MGIKELSKQENKTRMTVAISPVKMNVTKKVCRLFGVPTSQLVETLVDEFLEEELFDLLPEQIENMKLTENETDFVNKKIQLRTCKKCGKNKTQSRDHYYCYSCFEINRAERLDTCLNCGKGGVKEGCWGHCKKCWDSNEIAEDSGFADKIRTLSPKVDIFAGKKVHVIREKLKEGAN